MARRSGDDSPCPTASTATAAAQTRERADFGGRIRLLEAHWRRSCDVIAEQEFNLLCTQEERVRLSPRAVEQGWAEQLDCDVRNHRLAVTDSKAEALFQVRRAARLSRRARGKGLPPRRAGRASRRGARGATHPRGEGRRPILCEWIGATGLRLLCPHA
jgi:hypothetical protein